MPIALSVQTDDLNSMVTRIGTPFLYSGMMALIVSCAPVRTDSTLVTGPFWAGRHIEMKAVNPYQVRIPTEGVVIKCSGHTRFKQAGRSLFPRKIIVNGWSLVVDPGLPPIGIMSFDPSVLQDLPWLDHLDDSKRFTVIGRLYDQNGVDPQAPQERSLVMYDVQYVKLENEPRAGK